jgi:hypothetical protein
VNPIVPILAIIAAVCIGLVIVNIHRQKEIHRLKERYHRLTFASPKVADEALRLQIVRLKNMAPGRSEKWYLERLIHELESSRIRHLQ